MKNIITSSLCIIASIILSDCSSNKSSLPSEESASTFSVVTLRKQVVHFNNVESGLVIIPTENLSKMSAFGKDGNPVYPSAEIAGKFESSDKIKISDNSGLCIKFTVPRIKLGDYCMINVQVSFPREIKLGTKTVQTAETDYKYDSKASGRTEYIWFLFDASSPETKVPGIWAMKLSSGGRVLTERKFTVSGGN